jgi:hypothetical protein
MNELSEGRYGSETMRIATNSVQTFVEAGATEEARNFAISAREDMVLEGKDEMAEEFTELVRKQGIELDEL